MRELLVVNFTLGELIRKAREDKGLSRTKLAEFAGITPNSMVRYEMAGTSDGKYPPVKKLMKICEVLELDPRNAFDAVKYEDYLIDVEKNISSKDENPYEDKFGFRFSVHFRADNDPHILKYDINSVEDMNTLVDEQAFQFNQKRVFQSKRIEDKITLIDLFREVVKEEIHQALDVSKPTSTQNGPDQDGPSRSEISKNNTKAVDAASTRKPGGTDEAV